MKNLDTGLPHTQGNSRNFDLFFKLRDSGKFDFSKNFREVLIFYKKN